jgi:hypothetical protein
MLRRFAVSSVAVVGLIAATGASAPAQAEHWGGPGNGYHRPGPPPGYWAWKRRHFHHDYGYWRPQPRPYAAHPVPPYRRQHF